MVLWRLSIAAYADVFDGGYGLVMEGRWNLLGQRVTYAATVPSLCLLEKLVHIEDPDLLPDDLMLVRYDVPDDASVMTVEPQDLPADWRRDETVTQRLGTEWYGARNALLMRVPSAIVGVPGAPDRNVVINHSHPEVARIVTTDISPFTLDPRLLRG